MTSTTAAPWLCEHPETPVRQARDRGPLGVRIHRVGCPACVRAVSVLVQSGLMNPRRGLISRLGFEQTVQEWLDQARRING